MYGLVLRSIKRNRPLPASRLPESGLVVVFPPAGEADGRPMTVARRREPLHQQEE